MREILIQYVKDKKNQRRGVVVARAQDDQIVTGWSYANFKAGDKFDKEVGINIAVGRIIKPSPKKTVPHDVAKVERALRRRAINYFFPQPKAEVPADEPPVPVARPTKKFLDGTVISK